MGGVGERDAGGATEITDQLAGRAAVVVRVVEVDLAARTAEPESRVREHLVAASAKVAPMPAWSSLEPPNPFVVRIAGTRLVLLAPAGV